MIWSGEMVSSVFVSLSFKSPKGHDRIRQIRAGRGMTKRFSFIELMNLIGLQSF